MMDDLIDKLNEFPADGDEEGIHLIADDILLTALRRANYGDVADAWDAARERVGFWYA